MANGGAGDSGGTGGAGGAGGGSEGCKSQRFPSGKRRFAMLGGKHSAFTLSEVLVALTLFTLLVVAVGQSISNNMRALAEMNSGGWDTPSMRAIREHILNINSREQIEEGGEIEIAGWPKPGDRANTTAAQPTKIRWTAEINPTSTLDLYTVTVELQVDNADDPIEADFMLHAYRPAWSTPEDRERILEAKQERLEAIRTARGEKRKEAE